MNSLLRNFDFYINLCVLIYGATLMGKTFRNRIVDLNITAVSKKGNGLAVMERPNIEPAIVEVPFTIPGDIVRVQLLGVRGGTYKAKLEEVITPSPDRITPKCVHFAVCGGCRYQQISYENQLLFKEQHIQQCFEKLLSPETVIGPIVPCVNTWHYRNKMEYSFSSDSAGKKYLGLIMDSTRGKVFNLTECHLTHSWFVDTVKCVRHWWNESNLDAYHSSRDTGSLRTLTLREGQRTGDRMVVLTVSGNPEFALQKHHLNSFVAYIRDAIEPINPSKRLSIFLRIQQIGKGMATSVYEMHLYGPDHIREILYIQVNPNEAPITLNFDVGPSTFFQPNSQQAEKLYSLALRLADIPKDAVIYDLYCGTGALGLCIAKHVKQVVGIEILPEAALDARTNAKRNNCNNVTIIAGAVRHVLPQLPELHLPAPDIVMVDPPRPGLDPEVMKSLLSLLPPKILYISCNPSTQAINVTALLEHGYQISVIQPIDQFPQTYHVENIVVLTRKIK